MSTQAVPIAAGRCTPIYPGGYQSAVNVKNTGTTTAYLDTQQGVASGYPLSVGSSLVWDAKRPLFVSADPGAGTTVIVTDNGGALFDASAVASQILGQGLSTQIASSIFASGIPVVEQLTTYRSPILAALNTVGEIFPNSTGGTYDASKIQTVVMEMYGITAVLNAYVGVTIAWYNTPGAGAVAFDTYNGWLSSWTLRTPAKAPYFDVSVVGSPAMGAAQTPTFTIRGSQRVVDKPQFTQISLESAFGFVGAVSSGYIGRLINPAPASPALLQSLPPRAGKARLYMRCSVTAIAEILLVCAVGDHYIASWANLAVGTPVIQETLALPIAPCYLYLSSGTLANMRIALIWEP